MPERIRGRGGQPHQEEGEDPEDFFARIDAWEDEQEFFSEHQLEGEDEEQYTARIRALRDLEGYERELDSSMTYDEFLAEEERLREQGGSDEEDDDNRRFRRLLELRQRYLEEEDHEC